MYTCGPTVYNYAHIGNLRAFMFEDLLRRYLEYKGFTSPRDEHHGRRRQNHPHRARIRQVPLTELTDFYTQEFFRDLDTLNIKRAHIIPRATETIPDMIEIDREADRQEARLRRRRRIGLFLDQVVSRTTASWRTSIWMNCRPARASSSDEYDKETMADFALVESVGRRRRRREMADSPWGDGRPGWHIECSVMSMKHLGETFDIHCGGEDLIFPHHEDEIAQSEAATGKPFVRYWLHNAHLLVEGKKMSKSLGNFYTLRDLLAKGWTGREVRYVLLSAHYRDQLNFTFDGLQAARSALQRMDEFLLKLQESQIPPAACPIGSVADLKRRWMMI